NLADALPAVADLVGVEETRVTGPLSTRVKTHDGFRLLDEPVGFAADVTGGHVQELCAQKLRHADQALDAIDVGAERVIDWREKVDASGAIDDEAHPPCQLFQVSGLDAASGTADVALPDGNLASKEILPPLLRDGCQRRRSQGFTAKPLVSRKVARRPEQDVKVLEVRETLEHQPQDHLAQEAVRPGQDDLMLLERLSDVGQEQFSRHRQPLPGTAFGALLAPGCQVNQQTAFLVGGSRLSDMSARPVSRRRRRVMVAGGVSLCQGLSWLDNGVRGNVGEMDPA